MIVIKNREILIPNNEQFIGTVYDNNADTRFFKIDRVLPGQIDLNNFTFAADVKYSNNATDSLSLTKETVTDDSIVLRMSLPASVLSSHVGNMAIQVRCSDTAGRTWSTAPANMYIMDQISNPGAVVSSTTLTELQQTETTIEASETLRIAAETSRASAETGRVNAESARVIAENGRVSAEESRVLAESGRASAETSRANAETARGTAETGRTSAETGRVNAEAARVIAEASRVSAEAARAAEFDEKSLESEGWAKGTQNDVPVSSGSPYYHDNSKYYKEQAGADSLVAEGWAKGTQNGVEVGSSSPYYHDNSKYYKEQAGQATVGFVSYAVEQDLNATAKARARGNIDAYTKPSGGIPSSDMASAVQTSLSKAETALQIVPNTYRTSADQDVIDATLQPKTDASLTTTAQTVVGAINEHETDISTLNLNKADKTQLANRNLLDNPWFTVNQRGQSSYTGSNYTVDRWKIANNSAGTITVNNDKTITFTTTSGYVWLLQVLEIGDFVGKTLTLSANVTSVDSGWAFMVMYSDNTSESFAVTTGIISYTFTPTKVISGIYFMKPSGAGSITIRAVKLELGSVSTLHMDVAPNYAEELLKCQRYYQIVNGRSFHFISNTVNSINASATIPIDLRATPSLSYSSNFSISSGDSSLGGFSYSLMWNGGNTLQITATKSNHGISTFDKISFVGSLYASADL